MGQTGVIKLEILCLWLLSPLLLLLELLNVFGGHRKPYIGSVESQSDLPPCSPYRLNWANKITDLVFLMYNV